MTVLALDIGATKIAVGLVGADGVTHEVGRIRVPESGVWEAVSGLLLAAANGHEVAVVGIGSCGPVDAPAGITTPLNIPEWREGFALVDAVRELFPGASVRMAIDGVCLALAERHFGAARETPDALAMTVSSGIGGGIIVGGMVAVGRTGNAGHIGHMIVPGSTDPCACGGVGCVEAVASGPSAVRWARERGWTGSDGVELAAAAQAGDRIAKAALRRAGIALGQVISSAAALLDVDLVVVGGGFAQSGEPLWRPLQEALGAHARIEFLGDLRVVPSELGEQATLVGAGLLTALGGRG
ncbi:N-acetylmannosamine kinase [Nocardia farcinica]|uniref:N-acetylmannosamine kinase n=1 Tax=Nocardia farcinica TaxID=37329 RepID=A0A449H4F1_NOCFR|nr:ROK family protein [Nocardia farcinica]VFA92900.1 N-acetylmannosamine kinase [Nocardia farcinica]